MVRSLDGDTEFFVIVAGVLQWDKLAPYLYTICLANLIRMSIDLIKENSFILKKNWKSKISADYADDLALLSNTHAQVEFL